MNGNCTVHKTPTDFLYRYGKFSGDSIACRDNWMSHTELYYAADKSSQPGAGEFPQWGISGFKGGNRLETTAIEFTE